MQLYDYSGFSLKRLNEPKFSHIKMLIFWPLFGLLFNLLEKVFIRDYNDIYIKLDDYIPFCEVFVIPYYFWFLFLIGMLIYGFLFDVPAFKNYMKVTMLTYGICILTYIIYPNAQQLRPETFARDNIFIDIVKRIHSVDTNTNVCPSMHVTGSFAVYFAARKSLLFSSFKWRVAFFVTTLLICASTVFLKQHSIVDVFAGIIVSYAVYPFVFKKNKLEKEINIEKKQKQYA